MKVSRWGDSLVVRIPQPLAEQARFGEGDDVDLTAEEGVLTLRRREAELDLEHLVEAITPENRHDETDWGSAEGREAW